MASRLSNGPTKVPALRGSSPQQSQRRESISKRAAFGDIVSLLMRTKEFRALTLAQIEKLVVPAVTTEQFLIAEEQSKANGLIAPVAMVLWASVSQDVDRRLSENLTQPLDLGANEWKSGDIPWLVAIAGNARAVRPILKRLQETVLKDRPLKMRVKGSDGRVTIKKIGSQRRSY